MGETSAGFFSFLTSTTLSVSLFEIIILTALGILLLLIGKHKIGLIVTILFVFYWVYISNRPQFLELIGNSTGYIALYILFAVVLLFAAAISFLIESR